MRSQVCRSGGEILTPSEQWKMAMAGRGWRCVPFGDCHGVGTVRHTGASTVVRIEVHGLRVTHEDALSQGRLHKKQLPREMQPFEYDVAHRDDSCWPGARSRYHVHPWTQEIIMAIAVTRSAGMLLLAIWLILTGLGGLVAFPLPGVIMAVLALIAGVLILVGR
jgi:hypothetical protein